MTSAERAKEIVKQIDDMEGIPGWLGSLAGALIAKAITQAQNDKLEEAARVAENPGFIQARDTEWDMGVNYAKPFIANAIRSLKSKDTP